MPTHPIGTGKAIPIRFCCRQHGGRGGWPWFCAASLCLEVQARSLPFFLDFIRRREKQRVGEISFGVSFEHNTLFERWMAVVYTYEQTVPPRHGWISVSLRGLD